MSQILMEELNRTKKRLTYYSWLKEKSAAKSPVINKWIDLYTERSRKIELQLTKAKQQQARAH